MKKKHWFLTMPGTDFNFGLTTLLTKEECKTMFPKFTPNEADYSENDLLFQWYLRKIAESYNKNVYWFPGKPIWNKSKTKGIRGKKTD